MLWTILKILISATIIAAVSSVTKLSPRWGAVLLTLPIVSLIALVFVWTEQGDIKIVSRLARETLILVPLGLPFFVPLAFADRLHLGFWPAYLCGVVLATLSICAWLKFGPTQL